MNARKFVYLLSLPMPVDVGDACPLKSVRGVDERRIKVWWEARGLLASRVRVAQNAAWQLRSHADAGGAQARVAVDDLELVLQQANVTLRLWRALFADFVALGSARAALGELAFQWQTVAQHAVYEIGGGGCGAGGAKAAHHLEASLVFELVCLSLLVVCCRQQLAALVPLCADGDSTYSSSQLRAAESECKILRTELLPLHFGDRSGTESWLLAPQFHAAFVAPLLRAQRMYASGVEYRTNECMVEATACFECAATELKSSARSGFAEQCELGALAAHRHGLALLSLAQALDEQSRGGGAEGDEDEKRAHAIEAVVCARAAADLLGEMCSELMQKLWKRAQTLYGFFVDQSLLAEVDGARHSVRIELVADGGFSVGRMHAISPTNKVIDLNAKYHFKLLLPL